MTGLGAYGVDNVQLTDETGRSRKRPTGISADTRTSLGRTEVPSDGRLTSEERDERGDRIPSIGNCGEGEGTEGTQAASLQESTGTPVSAARDAPQCMALPLPLPAPLRKGLLGTTLQSVPG